MNSRRVFLLTVVLVLISMVGGFVTRTALGPNSIAQDGRFVVEPGQPVDSIVAQLDREGRIAQPVALRRYLSWRGWTEPGTLKAGRYLIPEGLDNRTLARLLMSGSREAVRVRFTGGRSVEDLAEAVAPQVAFDAEDLIQAMRDPLLAARKGTDMEIGILASIVKAETSKMDEAPTVAGLYLNRLERGMRLQADPTLIHALGDPSIRRVLNVHREIDSPYNTYVHQGLPPGPINFPEPAYLEAVLNAEEHDYLFMCAREDFSGYHAFARTNREHERNARRYRMALDRQGVYR